MTDSAQETVRDVSSRQSTRRTLTEDAVAMTRDPSIERVAHEPRHDRHEQRDESPTWPETAQDAHDRIGVGVTLRAFEQQKRQRIVWIDAMRGQQISPARGLHGRELVPAAPVSTQHEVHPVA